MRPPGSQHRSSEAWGRIACALRALNIAAAKRRGDAMHRPVPATCQRSQGVNETISHDQRHKKHREKQLKHSDYEEIVDSGDFDEKLLGFR